MRYRFLICDVFTTVRFGGNQLAVLPEAVGLEASQMQRIAREFNFSETTFVLPASDHHSRRLRIFTPTMEVPFAGHPNIGTAFALAQAGFFGEIGDGMKVIFDEGAGPVEVTIERDSAGRLWCEMMAPQALSIGPVVDPAQAAAVLSLEARDIRTLTHAPRIASVGLPFVMVELESRDALQRAHIDLASLGELRDSGVPPDIHVYVRSNDEFDIRARMFSPFDNTPEDPATGSANCALVALLAHCGVSQASGRPWRIAQGVEMGRPSMMQVRIRQEGDTARAMLAGHCVLVGEGLIFVD